MAKKKKKPGKIGGRLQPVRPNRAVVETLDEAFRLKQHGRDAQAIELLEKIDRQHPGQRDVLLLLAECQADTKDWHGQMETSEKLVQHFPQDADVHLMLAGAYLNCYFPILAEHHFLTFLARWPQHPRAVDVQRTAAKLAPRVNDALAQMGQLGPDRMELGVQHERIQVSLMLGRYAEVHRRVETFLQRWPPIPAVLNNLAEACFAEGDSDAAIAATRKAIEAAPENVHAHASLTRYLFLSGQIEEAREAGVRLQPMPVQRPENWIKKAETFSYLGDDQAVIAAWREAEAGGFHLVPTPLALLHHLAAVAFCRQGNEAEARRLWRLSLDQVPGYTRATETLRDLDLPAGEKNGPWAHGLSYWIPQRIIAEIAKIRLRKDLEHFLQSHPEVVRLLPHLLDRGDAAARHMVVGFCSGMKTPELLAVLRDFALGQRGTDKMRIEAAMVARREAALPAGMTRLWIKGEWRDKMLVGFNITFDPLPSVKHGPRVEQLAADGSEALHAGDGLRAERLLREALKLEPDARDLMNNLASSYVLQGQPALARAIYRGLHQKHPDYLFAAVEVARMDVEAGQFDEARNRLNPFLNRTLLHITELEMLVLGFVELELASGQPEGARTWLEMLEQIHPDSRRLPALRAMMDRSRRWSN